ncbi:hypothetical protein MKX01_008652, partial [Papaver californicum]
MEKCIIPCLIMVGMVHNPLPINATVQTGYNDCTLHCSGMDWTLLQPILLLTLFAPALSKRCSISTIVY